MKVKKNYIRGVKKQNSKRLDFSIDKLTNSIENAWSGDGFSTEVSLLTKQDLKIVTKKNGWLCI